jgi:hypothetical protein
MLIERVDFGGYAMKRGIAMNIVVVLIGRAHSCILRERDETFSNLFQ